MSYSILSHKKKMKKQQIENKKDFQDVEPEGVSKDLDEIITKVKSKKKVLN